MHKELAPVMPLGQSDQATLLSDDDEHAPAPPMVQWAVVALLVWLPLQTPVAIALFQYAHLSVDAARAILLFKDLLAALLIVTLAILYLKRVHMHWFDWMAVGYMAVLGAYAVIPLALGTKLGPIAIVASAREFLVPVEMYGLGRLACAAGVNVGFIVRAFLIIAGVAAAATLILHIFVPATFWSSTLNLVRFERFVQGIATARTLWDIGLLGQYGVGDTGSFARAIGPFTHPVGTAHYFVVPLVLAATAVMAARRAPASTMLTWLAVVVLFVAAVLTPISRGAWLAAVVGVMVAALLYRRLLPAAVGVGIVVVFILLVPPFSYSVSSALGGTDSSVEGHGQAIEKGIKTAVDNPWGLGLGQADQFGASLAQEGASAAVGENLYLTLYVSVGPIGLLAFVAWVVGVLLSLLRAARSRADPWIQIGMAVVMIGLLISGLTAAHLLRFTTGATFWLLVGLLVSNGPLPALGGSLRGLRERLYTRPHA